MRESIASEQENKAEEPMKRNTLTVVLFIIYVLALTWIVLFKLQLSFEDIDRIREINLIPFQGSVIVNSALNFGEIIANILVFIPLGIFLCILKSEWSLVKKVLPIIGLTLAFELIQFIFAIGRSDITDILGNTLGGIIGIGIYALLFRVFKNRAITVINILALALTVCALVLIAMVVFKHRVGPYQIKI